MKRPIRTRAKSKQSSDKEERRMESNYSKYRGEDNGSTEFHRGCRAA